MRVRALLAAVTAGLLVGCGTSAPAPAVPADVPSSAPTTGDGTPATVRTVQALPANGRFDYQIGGPYEPAADVAVVDRDRSESPAAGRYGVCYVNAFQTQPEDARFWLKKHSTLVARRHGKPVTDPDWPGELLLDTHTKAKRKALLRIVGPWVDGCATSGFDAVEPDNLDSWTRSKGTLTRKGNLAFAKLLVVRAHAGGLAVAQKNTSELGTSGRDTIGFDFAVAEECQVYDECDAYTDVYGDQVVEVEYTDNPRPAYEAACRARGDRISVVLRDRDVVPRGARGYAYEEC